MKSSPENVEKFKAPKGQSRGDKVGLSSVSEALDIIGDTWMLRLLARMMLGLDGWSSLSSGLGISPTTLSKRLKQLEEADCVVKDKAYTLTDRGRELFQVIAVIDEWRLQWDNPDGTSLSPWDHSCGEPLRCRMACRGCHGDLQVEAISFQANSSARAGVQAASRHFRNAQSAPLQYDSGKGVPSRILQVLGDRRASRLSAGLTRGNARFEDLQNWTNLHPATVSERLRKFQLLGLAHMQLYQENPDRYYYASSRAGRDLYQSTQVIMQWADRWLFRGETPPVTVTHVPCGSDKGADLVCKTCEGLVTLDSVRLARPEIEPMMI